MRLRQLCVAWVSLVALSACDGTDTEPGIDGDGDPSNDVPSGEHCEVAAAWEVQSASFEEEVLRLTNRARAQGHDCDSEGSFGPTRPLTMEPRLRCAARLHSSYMAETGDFSHVQSATGLDPSERMSQAGYAWSNFGENIAVGQSSAEEVVAGWLESDGHCSNLMSPDFTEIGIGYAVGPFEGGGQSFDAPYWTQNFARPR